MMRGGAIIAIVTARLRKELHFIFIGAAACGMLAYLQRFDDALAQLAGSLLFGTLTGVTVALLQRGSGRFRELELCEQTAPLYGRELARATALVPCAIVTAALAAYWLVAASFSHPPLASIARSLPAVYAATLVALSATVRAGVSRWLYVALAGAVAAFSFAIAERPIALSLLFSVLVAFIALRQYGEALARYDPV